MVTICGYEFGYLSGDPSAAQGIYVPLDQRRDGSLHVLDVGESGDLQERLTGHPRADCWESNAHGQVRVSVLYTPGWSADQRRTLESRIRNTYSPPCGSR